MTAEEYALENMHGADLNEIESALIGFAKLKCEELLEIVAEEAQIKQEIEYIHSSVGYGTVSVVDKDSILNAVNLDEFIK